MERRPAGIGVLLFAVFAALVVPQLLKPGVVGRPSAAPLPEPPAIGACVVLSQRSARVVDCAESHDGEVFARWLADDPDRPRDRHSPVCNGITAEVSGDVPPTLDDWQLTVLAADTSLIRAPRSQRAGDRGWSACVLRPANHARYVGSLAEQGSRHRPAAFGYCFGASVAVGCGEPHLTELLATTSGWVPSQLDEPLQAMTLPSAVQQRLEEECLGVARQLTGNPDPTYGAQLAVQVVGRATDTDYGADTGGRFRFAATCELAATGGQLLTDSVVGLGVAPLPLG